MDDIIKVAENVESRFVIGRSCALWPLEGSIASLRGLR